MLRDLSRSKRRRETECGWAMCMRLRSLLSWQLVFPSYSSCLLRSFHMSSTSWSVSRLLKRLQYPLYDPNPAASVRLNRDELSWAGLLWREALESPHLAYICALRSFDFWLMVSSSFTKAGLFRSCRLVRLRAALAPVATAGAAFHSLGHRRQTF